MIINVLRVIRPPDDFLEAAEVILLTVEAEKRGRVMSESKALGCGIRKHLRAQPGCVLMPLGGAQH